MATWADVALAGVGAATGLVASVGGVVVAHRLQTKREREERRRVAYQKVLYLFDSIPARAAEAFLQDDWTVLARMSRDVAEAISEVHPIASLEVRRATEALSEFVSGPSFVQAMEAVGEKNRQQGPVEGESAMRRRTRLLKSYADTYRDLIQEKREALIDAIRQDAPPR